MESETCSMCIIEKDIRGFFSQNADFEDCEAKRALKRCYGNKDEKLQQQRDK